jgi:hypothetical protein
MSRGRDGAKGEAWERRLGEFDRGGATVAAFCAREGVSVASFYQWRRKLAAGNARQRKAGASRSPGGEVRFLPIEIAGGTSSVEVLLPGGAKLLVPSHEHETLRTILAALLNSQREAEPC